MLRSPRSLFATLLFGVAIILPTLRAADAPEAKEPDLTEQRQVLQIDLERLYGLIQQDADPQTKVTLLGHHRELTSRANRLLDKFDPAKYDELRYDINIQCQRLARKQAPLAMEPATMRVDHMPVFAIDELNPSPSNPAEVKAALDVVDVTIKRMEVQLGRMTAGTNQYLRERDRIQRLKQRRVALGKEFTTAGWNGLVGDLK